MLIQPSDTAEALAMAQAGLSFLADCDAPELPTAAQGQTLIGLEHAEARLTVARARILSAFTVSHGYEADGQFGPRPWLRAFTRVTKSAALGAMTWTRRLDAHPAVAAAMVDGQLSASWAREICAWTDRLPDRLAADADRILLAAAAGGAALPDLAVLAWEMIERARTTPDVDEDGFADRSVSLDTTLGGAGRLTGDLSSACAAALTAVLDSLGTRTGPEDIRSSGQRRHDALEEACQRLIAAGLLPGRDGQPLRVYAHLDLATLAGAEPSGRSALETNWPSGRTVAGPAAWCPTGTEADAAACDATVIPVVTGHPDWTALDQLTDLMLQAYSSASAHAARPGPSGPLVPPGPSGPDPALRERLQRLLLQQAVTLLSGPSGLAAHLRAQLPGHPMPGLSQPLDLGAPTPVIPPHLRRAVTLRDRHCRFPGCQQPPSVTQVHHLIPRARAGPTALDNLALLCRFHHLIVVHRWGWALTCHSDGTSTAVSPEGRTLHSHGPPSRAA